MTDELSKAAEESARGSFFLIAGKATSTIILAIGSILIVRFLNPELYGQYSLALVLPQLLYIFADLGISQAINKYTAELISKGETSKLQKIVKTGILLRLTAGLSLFIINFFFADLFSSIVLQRPELALYIKFASFSVLFQVIFTSATSTFVGFDKTEYEAITTNIQAILKIILQTMLILVGLAITGAIIGHVVSYFFAGIIGLLLLIKVLRKEQNSLDETPLSKNICILVRYGSPLYISALFVGFIPFFQNILLSIFTTSASVGYYRAAINFAVLLTVFSIPITTVLLPVFSKLNTSAAHKINEFFKLANKWTTIIIIPITFLVIIFSRELVYVVYGTNYQPASSLLATYCLLYLLVGVGYLTLSSFYNGLGETKITLRISTITLFVILVLSPLLIIAFNVHGLIASFLIASTAGQMYSLHYAIKKYKLKFDGMGILKIYLISILSSILPLLINNLLKLSPFINLIISGTLFMFFYITLIPLTSVITVSELNRASLIIKKVRFLQYITTPIIKYQYTILQKTCRQTKNRL